MCGSRGLGTELLFSEEPTRIPLHRENPPLASLLQRILMAEVVQVSHLAAGSSHPSSPPLRVMAEN